MSQTRTEITIRQLPYSIVGGVFIERQTAHRDPCPPAAPTAPWRPFRKITTFTPVMRRAAISLLIIATSGTILALIHHSLSI